MLALAISLQLVALTVAFGLGGSNLGLAALSLSMVLSTICLARGRARTSPRLRELHPKLSPGAGQLRLRRMAGLDAPPLALVRADLCWFPSGFGARWQVRFPPGTSRFD